MRTRFEDQLHESVGRVGEEQRDESKDALDHARSGNPGRRVLAVQMQRLSSRKNEAPRAWLRRNARKQVGEGVAEVGRVLASGHEELRLRQVQGIEP